VGTVSVDVVASASALAKSIRKEVEDAFKGLDLNALVRESMGNTKLHIPVEPDVDTDSIPAKVRSTRVPKVPVELDPVLAAVPAAGPPRRVRLARWPARSTRTSRSVRTPTVCGRSSGRRSEIQAQSKHSSADGTGREGRVRVEAESRTG
jgi:hypothetical protein